MQVIREREGAGIVRLWKAGNPGGTTWHGDQQGGPLPSVPDSGGAVVVWTVVGRKCLQEAKQGTLARFLSGTNEAGAWAAAFGTRPRTMSQK